MTSMDRDIYYCHLHIVTCTTSTTHNNGLFREFCSARMGDNNQRSLAWWSHQLLMCARNAQHSTLMWYRNTRLFWKRNTDATNWSYQWWTTRLPVLPDMWVNEYRHVRIFAPRTFMKLHAALNSLDPFVTWWLCITFMTVPVYAAVVSYLVNRWWCQWFWNDNTSYRNRRFRVCVTVYHIILQATSGVQPYIVNITRGVELLCITYCYLIQQINCYVYYVIFKSSGTSEFLANCSSFLE